MFRTVSMIVGVFFLAASTAGAGENKPLTEDQAKRFVASLEAVEQFGDELRSEGKIDQLNIDNKPKAGEKFAPYSNSVAALKEKYPADHARLAKAVKPHGFSPREWGHVGDKVMIAYLAVKMEEEDPRAMHMMAGMDESMIEMMPPEMKTQLEQSFIMMDTVKNAPAEDKKAVAAVKEDLDKYMDKESES